MADMLANPQDLASLLERDDIDTFKATLLIECATAVVQAIVGQRIIEVVDDTITLDVDEIDSGPGLLLPERPVTAVTAVQIGATPIADYVTQLRRGRIWRASGWRSYMLAYPTQPNGVTVTYTHGYPDGHQRLQLARSAVLALVKGAYANPTGSTHMGIGDYNASYTEISAQMDASPFLAAALKRQYGRPLGSYVVLTGNQTFAGGPGVADSRYA